MTDISASWRMKQNPAYSFAAKNKGGSGPLFHLILLEKYSCSPHKTKYDFYCLKNK